MTAHGPHRDVSTVCAQGILAVKQKGKGGRYTPETPHVLVEKQKKLRYTCYSAPNSHIPALQMTLLFSMMQENNDWNYGKIWFDDTTIMMITYPYHLSIPPLMTVVISSTPSSRLNSSFVLVSFMKITHLHLIICISALSNFNPPTTSKESLPCVMLFLT